MKTLLSGLLIVAGGIVAIGIGLSWMSRQSVETGPLDGRLQPCPDKPNCVCSEASADAVHRISAIPVTDADTAWPRLRRAIEQLGGYVVQQHPHYLHATFKTRFFRYIDDVEARLDSDAGVIHLRSASRVGHSDLGANRTRIEAIRQQFESMHGKR